MLGTDDACPDQFLKIDIVTIFSGISEVEFYSLLNDAVFNDYFNVFLSLPVRYAVFLLFL